MDREKQIDEMARDMCGLGRDCHGCTSSMSYVCKAKKYAERAVDKGYCKKSEVAREIFEEIEDSMSCFEDDDDGYLLKKCEFAFFMRELKKKYTEKSGNDR